MAAEAPSNHVLTNSAGPSLEQVNEYAQLKQKLRDKIINVLSIYPFVSPSMLHIGIGSSTPNGLWKPILEELVSEQLVLVHQVLAENPEGRRMTCTVYHLSTNPYSFPTAAPIAGC